MRDRVQWRDLGACLALVNLLYLDVWRQILALDVSAAYYLPDGSLSVGFFLWPVGMVIALALLLFAAGRVVRRRRHARLDAVARLAFLLLTLCALNAVRHLSPRLTAEGVARALGRPTLVLLTLGAASLAVVIMLRDLRGAARRAATLLLLTLPFFPVNLATTLGRVMSHRSLASKRSPPRTCHAPDHLPQTSASRVVIVVFDEMDQRYLSPSSPLALKLPALESLRDVALWSESALAPDTKTITSMPALISGVRVMEARPSRPDELEIELEDGRVVRWSEQPNLFRKACALGLESALVGWYHPYCRILGADLAYCAAYAYTPQPKADLLPQLLHQGILLGQTLPGVAALRLADRLDVPLDPLLPTPPAWHVRQFAEIRDRALALCADRRYALVVLHFPIPHEPYIYSPELGRLDATGLAGSYAANVLLADQTLAVLREAMEAAGVWHDSTLVVTSDHGSRKLEPTARSVPFVMKMAGQSRSLEYARQLDTIVVGDLALEILSGRLGDAEAAAGWLDRRLGRPSAKTPS